MFICNCNGVRCREVDAAIEAGAKSPRKVLAHHGHEPCCGRCLPEIAARLNSRKQGHNPADHTAFVGQGAGA
jgi:bacterioferritin-associated ferredoxin